MMMVGEIINAMVGPDLQTPIEIALGIDENGMTTARKLYDFLEMDKSHYSRWVKSSILENPFAEENIDYWAFAIDGERDFNPNPTQDFKLTAHFAKKLSMFRALFFVKEKGFKKLLTFATAYIIFMPWQKGGVMCCPKRGDHQREKLQRM